MTNSLKWVRFTYNDSSQFCFQTTLNTDILTAMGITLEEDKLPRLDKQYYSDGKYIYRQFSVLTPIKVEVLDECSYTHEPSRQLHIFF